MDQSQSQSNRPLDGVKVVEMATWMAGPSAAAVLADLGAEVIKIEAPRGDPLRGMSRQPKVAEGEPTIDAAFNVDNRGKRSVVLAVDQPVGADLARRLIAEADVFLTNLLVHRQQRYGLDPDSLVDLLAERTGRPGLVHATLTGYGLDGPEAWRPGYDVTTFFGRGGITRAMTPPGQAPPPAPNAQGDHTTGLAMVGSILAALRLAERTGETQVVDVSLLGTSLWSMAVNIAPSLIDGRSIRARGRHDELNPLVNRYPCADNGWILLTMPERRWWPRFCEAIGEPEWGADPDYDSPKKRYDRMAEIVDRIDAVTITRTAAEWGRIFDEAGLIWGPIQTISDVVADPQARSQDMFVAQRFPDDEASFDTVAVPIRIAGSDIGPRGTAPELGAHTAEVLRDLGLDADDLAKLAADGVIKGNLLG